MSPAAPVPPALPHGGDLDGLRRRHGDRPPWIDLSTGINPHPWPVPEMPPQVLQRLPPRFDGALGHQDLCRIAARCYGCAPSCILPLAGSQQAIADLPQLAHSLPPGAIAVPRQGYGEHRRAWQRAGRELAHHRGPEHLQQLLDARRPQPIGLALLINPGNPTAAIAGRRQLLGLHRSLRRNHPHGTLIVDEAFADHCPQHSLAPLCGELPGLMVLRSLGKFFGLAGLRLGFLLGPPALLAAMPRNPWEPSHPAVWAGGLALADRRWQARTRAALRRRGARLAAMLAAAMPECRVEQAALFASIAGPPDALAAMHRQLAAAHIHIRHFGPPQAPHLLRLGLPPAHGWRRLRAALAGPG